MSLSHRQPCLSTAAVEHSTEGCCVVYGCFVATLDDGDVGPMHKEPTNTPQQRSSSRWFTRLRRLCMWTTFGMAKVDRRVGGEEGGGAVDLVGWRLAPRPERQPMRARPAMWGLACFSDRVHRVLTSCSSCRKDPMSHGTLDRVHNSA